MRFVFCNGHSSKSRVQRLLVLVAALCLNSLWSSLAQAQRTDAGSSQRLSLLQLISAAESMDSGKRDYWIEALPKLKSQTKSKLRSILEKERSQLAAIDGNSANMSTPALLGVSVRNQTSSKVVIRTAGYWFDENGERVSSRSSWEFNPGDSANLLRNSRKVYASEFPYQVEIGGRVYPQADRCWVARYTPGRGTNITIDAEKISSRRVAAKPVIKDSDWERSLDGLNKLASNVNDAIDAYDKNVKPIVSAIKKVRKISSVQVVLHSAEVARAKENGKKWDSGGGAPDLLVRLEVEGFLGDSFESDVVKNSYSHTFDAEALRAKPGQTIKVSLIDKDAFANDSIGSHEFELTEAMISRGRVNLSFDQVESLVLRFTK